MPQGNHEDTQVRLIACDIDGTLLHGSETQVKEAVFTQIKRLRKKGIYFCPASGRQIRSLQWLFAPVEDDLYYVCENGSAIFSGEKKGMLLCKTALTRSDAIRVCYDILSRENCELLISGERTSYLCPKRDDIVHHIRDVIHNDTVILKKPEDTPEDIVKLAVFCRNGAEEHYASLKRAWEGVFSVAQSGRCWVDFTHADKGTGIRSLCERLDIPLSAVMAIGDNENDLPMLSIVGRPVVMENAAAALKESFPVHCRAVEDVLSLL